LGILFAFVPLLVLGITGTRLGAGTFLGGMLITLGYILAIVVATVVLKLGGTDWRKVGLARPISWPRTVLLGLAALVGVFLVVTAVQWIALNLPGLVTEPADVSRFDPVAGNLPLFLLYTVLAWTTITFGEEMFYRAFLISQLDNVFQGFKISTALAVLGSTFAFGLAHYQEGPVGILTTAAIGFLFALVYLRTGRNLWVTIIAHGLANTLRFAFIFFGAT
jgi:membrane protease YdiL (CAAX protease family)